MKVRSISIAVMLALVTSSSTLFLQGCPKKIPSKDLTIAQTAASIPLTLKAVRDIGAVLATEKVITVFGKDKLTGLTDKTVAVMDQIAGDLQAGKLDPASWDVVLQNLTNEWIAIGSIIATNIDPRVGEWVALAQYLIPLVKSLIDAIKPPAPPATPIIAAEGARKAQITPGGVAAIIAISVGASIKYLGIQTDTSVDSLWNKYYTYSAEYHGTAGVAR